MDPNQNISNNNIPSIKQPGNWSPLMDFSNDVQPPKKSFFSRYKKLIIICLVTIFLLVNLVVIASISSTNTGNYIEGPATTVPLSNYDKQVFSMNYASSLNILTDQASPDNNDYFLLFSEDKEDPAYEVFVYVTPTDPLYISAEEGLYEQQDEGIKPFNIQTSEVALAGTMTNKALGEFTNENGKEYYTAFSSVKIGEKFVIVSAKYPKDNKDIHDSFDAMIGSIKLK